MQTGQADPTARTFDLHGTPETEASLSVTTSTVNWTYRNANGELIRYSKAIANPTLGTRGDYIVGSKVTEVIGTEMLGGFAQVSKQNHKTRACIGKLLADATDLSQYTTRTFTDCEGRTRTAVLLPISL